MNAKQELIIAVADKTIDYGRVYREVTWHEYEPDVKFNNHDEYLASLDKLDFEYDNGYGGQELYGTIVFTDGTWLERGEYDGSEWWAYKEKPSKEDIMKDIET